ncbi:TPA: IS3 family transposase [Burkholderia vietnamiensis]|nr:IS3 family transposase [Burkholderia vietnamiensis]
MEPILAEINANDIDAVIVHGRSPRLDAPSIAQEVGQTIPLGYRALDVGRHRTYEVIDQIGASESVELICAVFDVSRSCLYAHRGRARRVDAERMALRSRVRELFIESRSSAGSRSIMGMMREEGTTIGRFKVSRLMEELGLICKQPGSHTPPSRPAMRSIHCSNAATAGSAPRSAFVTSM